MFLRSLTLVLIIGFVCACSSAVDFNNSPIPSVTTAQEPQYDKTPSISPDDAIPLENLYSEKTIQSLRVVKTCGWATNQFENVQISKNLHNRYQFDSVGFGMAWLSDEPRTKHPEWRCVTGRIRPVCGWEDHTSRVSNGTVHLYEIVQTELGRD